MIELKIQISDVDYEALAEVLAPLACDALCEKGGVSTLLGKHPAALKSALRAYLAVKGTRGMEKLLVRLVEKNRDTMIEKLESLAEQRGISAHIDSIGIESK